MRIRLLSLSLLSALALAACSTDELREPYKALPEEMNGLWMPEPEDEFIIPGILTTDRYIEFSAGQCLTYFSPEYQLYQNGVLYETNDESFRLTEARYCHLDESNHLIAGASDLGLVLLSRGRDKSGEEDVPLLNIGSSRYTKIKKIVREESPELSIDRFVLVRDINHLEIDQSDTIRFKVFLSGSDYEYDGKDFLSYVRFVSTDERVVSVDSKGVLHAMDYGEATVYLRANSYSAYASCRITVSGGDLSAKGTANSYLVSTPGSYSFKATRGTSNEEIAGVRHVSASWASYGTETAPQSLNTILYDIIYDQEAKRVRFLVHEDAPDGNVVIQAKDINNKLLWSWHIWFCRGYNPVSTANIYRNNAGTMMDRNLGALSDDPSNPLTMGLLYRWGHRDPFPGCIDFISQTSAAIAGNIPTYKPEDILPVEEWSKDKAQTDPCPPGWKVASGGENGIYATALGTSQNVECSLYPGTYSLRLGGTISAESTVVFPKTSIFLESTMKYRTDGYRSFLWTSYSDKELQIAYPVCLNFDASSGTGSILPVYPFNGDNRTMHSMGNAYPVRCEME